MKEDVVFSVDGKARGVAQFLQEFGAEGCARRLSHIFERALEAVVAIDDI